MDYSTLVSHIENGNEAEAGSIIVHMQTVLKKYLIVQMGANPTDAEDIVQEAFINGIEKIRAHKIQHKDKFFSYLITTCKHLYLDSVRKISEKNYESVPPGNNTPPTQIEHLITKERKNLLDKCLETIYDTYENFMRYWLQNPEFDAKQIANHFNVSIENVWTRKHRALSALQECLKKNLKKV